MVEIEGSIFNEILGPFNPFKILISVKLFTKKFKGKRSSYKHKRS